MKSFADPRDQAELLRRLRTVRPDSVRRWGRMSAHQMVCHLADAFRMALGDKPVSHDTSLLKRTLLKWVALYAPLPWPPGILTRPELDQQKHGTPPTDFATDVARVESLMELVTSRAKTLERQPHPLFGRMTERDWLRWSYAHVDHHLRQFGA